MSAQKLEVSLLGVGTVLRLERDAWSTVKRLRKTANEFAPPLRHPIMVTQQLDPASLNTTVRPSLCPTGYASSPPHSEAQYLCYSMHLFSKRSQTIGTRTASNGWYHSPKCIALRLHVRKATDRPHHQQKHRGGRTDCSQYLAGRLLKVASNHAATSPLFRGTAAAFM